jgi:hypothetical protein
LTLERIKQASVIILCLTLAVCIGIITPTLRGTLQKAQETAGETKRASTAIADWAEFQTTECRLQGTTEQSTLTLAELQTFIADLNKRTTGDDGLIVAATQLLEGINRVAVKFEVTVEELSAAIRDASAKTGKSLDAIYALIADPKMQQILLSWDQMSARGAEILANAKLASDRAPGIATSLESIAKTSSKFTKITLITNILATLARAFLP